MDDQERLSRLLSVDLETPRGDSTLVDPTLTWIERAGTEKQKKRADIEPALRGRPKKNQRGEERRERKRISRERK
ncbi:hypothetical protein AAG906_018533 [Vitis piasezkii]